MTAYDSQPPTRSLRRPAVSEREPAAVEKSALMTWCAPQSAGSIAVDTPAACACRIKYTSLLLASANNEIAKSATQNCGGEALLPVLSAAAGEARARLSSTNKTSKSTTAMAPGPTPV